MSNLQILLDKFLTIYNEQIFLDELCKLDPYVVTELGSNAVFIRKVKEVSEKSCWQCKHQLSRHYNEGVRSECREKDCFCEKFLSGSLEYLEDKYKEKHV
jgi:hypothetical protein